ncbi:hypothetical protein BASA81_003097 [Batrachochytrium salamandrivorans]|nr:hypothetical protein BASA81_003097 [Batrachochytrium salamandrivorans]
MSEEERGQTLMREGENLLRRTSIWGVFNPNQKFDDAKEKFAKAASLFKMAKSWELAGRAFERLAEMCDKLDIAHEANAAEIEAAEMYARVDKKKAVALFRSVASKSCELGRFPKAAQMLDNAGALLEDESDLEGAVDCYAKAADYYFSDRANSKGNKSLEKVGLLSADLGAYGDAAKVFEQLGYSSLESTLLKFGSKKHFLHAGFCYLGKGDVVAARMNLGRYLGADLSLKDSRECVLYEELCDAYEQLDVEAFTMALGRYDRILALDRWETSLLLKVKKAIELTSNAEPDLS